MCFDKNERSLQRTIKLAVSHWSEVFVDLHEEDDTDHEGFHLKLAVGDIVEVKKCRRKEGTALEPDIVT